MTIEVIDSWGDDLRVANVARVSFDNWKNIFEDKDAKLIHYLADHEHTSPFRHVGVTIRCEAPVFLRTQLMKHQVGLSWNEVSRRYVNSEPEFFSPATWRAKPEGSIKQGSGKDVDEQGDWYLRYDEHINNSRWLYNYMLNSGIAPEQARIVLPQSMLTSWIWTGSLLAFFHVWRLRSDGHAQEEAQYFARELDTIMSKLFPVSWLALKEAT